MKNKLFIIGSSGQIGSALMDWCRNNGVEAFGLDNRKNPWKESLTNKITNFENFDESLDFSDIIFLSTESSAKNLESDKARADKDMHLFLKACDLSKSNNARMVIVSSRELFGLTDSTLDCFKPKNAYEKQKYIFETNLKQMRQEGWRTGVIRVPIVCGGFDDDIQRIQRLIPRLCNQLVKEGKTVVTNSDNLIPFALVDDVVNSLMNELINNIGSFLLDIKGTSIKLSDLVNLIKQTYNTKNKKREEIEPLQIAIRRTLLSLDRC